MEIIKNFRLIKMAFIFFIKFIAMIPFIIALSILKSAIAATTGGTLPVSTLVTANCSLSSATMNFGNYDPITANASSPLPAVTTFQISCTKGANVTITLNKGLYGTYATGTTRAMSSGSGHYLSYELYSNPARSTVWNATSPVQFNSTSSNALTETVYGQIPAGQNAFAGSYSDTVTITATF